MVALEIKLPIDRMNNALYGAYNKRLHFNQSRAVPHIYLYAVYTQTHVPIASLPCDWPAKLFCVTFSDARESVRELDCRPLIYFVATELRSLYQRNPNRHQTLR